MRFVILLFLFLSACGGVGTKELDVLKPMTKDNKLALTLYNYNQITCDDFCLADYLVEKTYIHALTGEEETFKDCELKYKLFQCKDLLSGEEYALTPSQWQKEAQHIIKRFHVGQLKKMFSQYDFQCEQDFAKCEDNYTLIKALEEFVYEQE